MLSAVLLVAMVLGTEPLQGWVPEGKDVLPDTPVTECMAPSILPELEFSPILDNYTAGATLTYSCHNASWTLFGPSVIVCQNDGQWSSNFPACKYVICEELDTPANVGITYDKSDWPLLPGTVAVYSCQAGYELDGTDRRTCTLNGSWTGPQPKCIGKCSPMMAPNNSSVMYSPRGCQHENCTATIKCDRGFTRVDDLKYRCGQDRDWTPPLVTKCSRIHCDPPGDDPQFGKMEMHPPSKDGMYEYGVMLIYSCREGLRLEGKSVISCSGLGTWSGEVPKCVEESTTVVATESSTPGAAGDNTSTSTPAVTASPACPSPDPIPNGEYRIIGRQVVYQCAHGYRLDGAHQRNCLVNQSWSNTSPQCVLIVKTTELPFIWKQVFVDNKMWEGAYKFNNKDYHFKMWVTSVNIHPNGHIGALMVDANSKFNVKGYHSIDSLVFQISELLKPSERFPDLRWYVTGQLETMDHHYVYTGKVLSETAGFSTLTMRPSKNVPKAMPGHDTSPNMTALAMGITIAIVSIVIAAVLAAFCVKRKVNMRGGGHRTLTSFENPVYEYENSLKDPGA